MNYFAHGREYVHDPYFLAGTAVPDWLNVVDRSVRIRSKQAIPYATSDDSHTAAIARGILQHCQDDAWFHSTSAFAELSLELCRMLRDALPRDDGFRPHFVGHILVEILLDAALVAADPARLERYYESLDAIDPVSVELAVNAMAARSTDRLKHFIPLFSRERFLWDYADDAKLLMRLNQVMRRVGLPILPSGTEAVFAVAREMVYRQAPALLAA